MIIGRNLIFEGEDEGILEAGGKDEAKGQYGDSISQKDCLFGPTGRVGFL